MIIKAYKLAAIFVINSVVVKAKIQRPRTGPSRLRPRPRTQTCVLEDPRSKIAPLT